MFNLEVALVAREFLAADDTLSLLAAKNGDMAHPTVQSAWQRVVETTEELRTLAANTEYYENSRVLQCARAVFEANVMYAGILQNEKKFGKKDREGRRRAKHAAMKAAQRLRRAVTTTITEANRHEIAVDVGAASSRVVGAFHEPATTG